MRYKKDDVLSNKFAGVEERQTQFQAIKVQESDQLRVEERDAEEQAEQQEPTAVTSMPSVSAVGVLEHRILLPRVHVQGILRLLAPMTQGIIRLHVPLTRQKSIMSIPLTRLSLACRAEGAMST